MPDRVKLETVRQHANLALRRALYLHRVPFLRLLQWLARFRDTSTVVRWLLAVALLAAVIAALVFIPADLTVSSQGRLEPQRQRNIFAPQDSQIEELRVAHGDFVKQGQELATLRSRDLDYEFARVLGELQTTAEQFESTRTTRLTLRPQTAEERREHARLTAEEERLQRLLESLAEQKRLLEQVRTSLRLCSPLAGRVLTWQLDETLRQRPVRRGQTLMTIGDLQGPWILQLDVADRDLGYVLEAHNADRRPLEVAFSLATAPGQTFRGVVQEIALRVDPDDSRQPKATVTVAIAIGELQDPRPGASVAARIRCGQHRLGYVWLRDLIETVRTWLVF